MGDISGLIETVSDLNIDKKDMMKMIETGEYSIRDMRDQFKMISNMGPMSKIVGMIPGMSPEMLGPLGDEQGASKLKHYLCAMDSMTEQELDSDGKIFQAQPGRIYRIARGSGIRVQEIEELLTQFKHVTCFDVDGKYCQNHGWKQRITQDDARRKTKRWPSP